MSPKEFCERIAREQSNRAGEGVPLPGHRARKMLHFEPEKFVSDAYIHYIILGKDY